MVTYFVKDDYLLYPYNGIEIICLPTEEPLSEFHTNGYTGYMEHKFAKIYKNTENFPYTHEDIKQIQNITIPDLFIYYRATQLRST